MRKQIISINGVDISIPEYFQKVDSMPGDPENSVPYEVRSENAACIVFVSAEDYSKALPREQEELVNGIRHYLADNQGLIEVVEKNDYVFSIVKNLKEPHGVQYILTYQKYCNDFIINIQGYFEEIGVTGQRDSLVYALVKDKESIGDDESPFKGWSCDPYDKSNRKGALMNISEQARFDELFPGLPLSICRELVRCLTDGEN
ncbi:hypothetical protein SAMN04487934_11451 [Eubacterium ruminantium]|nr:hypothetical protein SAMN04487934_11451 [Eubacterium ruminantium]